MLPRHLIFFSSNTTCTESTATAQVVIAPTATTRIDASENPNFGREKGMPHVNLRLHSY